MTSQYPYIQFVATPDVGATLRYDFNDGTTEVASIDLGVPTLEGEPDGVNVQFGYRTLTIVQEVVADRPTALDRLSSLAREIMRRRNWLLVQPDATTKPVWFRTFRSMPDSLSIEKLSDGTQDMYAISVKLVAQPAAYGPLETTGELTVTYNPSSGSATTAAVNLPTIKGDLPVPARVEYYGKLSGSMFASSGDGWFAMSPCSATSTPITYNILSTASASVLMNGAVAGISPRPGRYRVVAIGPTAGGTAWTDFRFGWCPDGTGVSTVWASNCLTTSVSTFRSLSGATSPVLGWWDLGEITFRSQDGNALTTPYVKLNGSGNPGAAVSLLLIPVVEFGVDEVASIMEHVKAPSSAANPVHYVIDDSDDHDHQAISRGTPSGTPGYLFTAAVAGASRLIMHPQWANRLTILTTLLNDFGPSAFVKVSYRPRYLNLNAD